MRKARPFVSRSLAIAAFALLLLLASFDARSQGQVIAPPRSVSDTSSILGALREPPAPAEPGPLSAMGIDLLVSNGGFGLGTFYRRAYSEDLAAFLDLSFSEAKDDEEKDFVDYYGRLVTPGKVNRFLVIPLFAGVQRRLFREEIVDNFRPFVSAAAGPVMLYVFPADEEFFTGIGHGHPVYTAGGYLGVGAYFGSERSNLMGLHLRYYVIPYPAGLESMQNVVKKQFGGFYIALSFGSAW